MDGGRWSELEDCIAEQGQQPRITRIASQESVGPKLPTASSWKPYMDSPAAISLAVALFVMIMLLIIRPPFVYNRRRSRIHPDFYIETFSPFRLIAWTGIAGVVTLVGSDIDRMHKLRVT